MTEAEREAQIVALWEGRPPARRGPEDVLPFYHWLVDYAPWLVPPGAVSLDQIRAVVDAYIVNTESAGEPVRRARRRHNAERNKTP
jgi:hypothetical protein